MFLFACFLRIEMRMVRLKITKKKKIDAFSGWGAEKASQQADRMSRINCLNFIL